MHADADGEGIIAVVAIAVRAVQLGADRAAEPAQRQAAAHGALGVVLGRLVGAECSEQAVAGVLQHPAAMRLHDGGGARERAVHQRARVLGIEPLAHARRADDVHEQDADLLQRLRRGRGRVVRRSQRVEPGPHRPERTVDDRVAKQGTLRFERGDAAFQLLLLGCHEGGA